MNVSIKNVPAATNQSVGLTRLEDFEFGLRVAKMLSSSTLVPKEYAGNVANTAIALNMAARIGADPLQVMQSLVVVHGRPTWSAQFLIACFNQCGRYSSIRYRFTGERGKDTYGCVAYATELATGEQIESSEITIGLAKAEGWYSRNGSKWQTIPQHMLMLRSAAWLVRTHAPELAMGLATKEEAIDAIDLHRDNDGSFSAEPIAEVEKLNAEFAPQQQPAMQDPANVDTATGEILNAPDNRHADTLTAIEDCRSITDLAKLMNELPRDVKSELKPVLRAKHDRLKNEEHQTEATTNG